MEAFSLLKYWRGGGGGVTGNNAGTTPGTTTISTTVQEQPAVVTEDEDDDDGSFFDLEFTVPNEDDGEGGDDHDINEDNDSGSVVDEEDDSASSTSAGIDGEREFNFTMSSGSSGGRTDPNPSLSPSDDLFFKGRFVPLEPSSLVFNPSEPNSKSQFPVSLLKSATKLRVLNLGSKKPKSTMAGKMEAKVADAASPKQQHHHHQQGKIFTVKLKVEEVPIVSLFTRDNSSRSFGKLLKPSSDDATTEDKKFSTDVVHKYLKMIKPLYVKVSRRYGDKLKFSGQLNLGLGKTVPAAAPTTTSVSSPKITKNYQGEAEESDAQSIHRRQKQGNFPAGLRVVCKHLGKSRSASSAVAAAPTLPSRASRRNDSLLEQQDGIQSAILHCKRSFNATRDSETSMLSRCTSDPSHEKWISSSRNPSDVHHRKTISSSRISSDGRNDAQACI